MAANSPQLGPGPDAAARGPKRRPTEEEIEILLAEPFTGAFPERDRLVVHLLYGSGIQAAADLVRINVDDLRDSAVVLVGTKTRKERFVSLSQPVQDALHAYLPAREARVTRRNLETKALILGQAGAYAADDGRPRADIINRIVQAIAQRKGLSGGWNLHALNKLTPEELAEARAKQKWDSDDGRLITCFLCGSQMQRLGRRSARRNHLWEHHKKELVGAKTPDEIVEIVPEYQDYCESQGWGRPPTTSLYFRKQEQEKLTDEEKALRIRCPLPNVNGNGQPCGRLLRNLSKHVVQVHHMPPALFRRLHPDVPLVIPSIAAGSRSRLEAGHKKKFGLPENWWTVPESWRIIVTLIRKEPQLDNHAIALRLDEFVKCPYGRKHGHQLSWVEYEKTRAGEIFFNRVRNWLKTGPGYKPESPAA